MSGHSKWSTIKRKKAANDAKRGSMFTRLAREITVAAREGGGDPDTNVGLRLAIERAKANNLPKDNITRAIRRGTGEDKDGVELAQILYEAYGPHGVALMIDVITDNRNRTVADIRHLLTRSGGNLAEVGAVSWQFERAAYFAFPSHDLDADAVFEAAVDAGADDVSIEEDIEVTAPVESFKSISEALQALGIVPSDAGMRMLPKNTLDLDIEPTLKVMRIIEELEDLDDVQQVYSNLQVTEDAVAQLEAA